MMQNAGWFHILSYKMESQTTMNAVYAGEWKTYWFNLLACPVFDKYKHGLETFRVFVPPNVKNVNLQIGEITKMFNDDEMWDSMTQMNWQMICEDTKNVIIVLSKFDVMPTFNKKFFVAMFGITNLTIMGNMDFVEDNCTYEYHYDDFENVDEKHYTNNESAYVSRRITGLLLMTICDFYTDVDNYDYNTGLPIAEMVFANDYVMQHIVKN